MKRIVCLMLSILMLFPFFGCASSKAEENNTAEETSAETIDYKNEPINQWIPYTPPQEMQEDLATLEGEVIEFKSLYYARGGIQETFRLISKVEQLDSLFEEISIYQLLSPTNFHESVAESTDQMRAQLQKIDFEKYDLLICKVLYSSSDFGFDGEPLVHLLKRENELVCVFQSDWSGDGADMDVWHISAFVLVERNQILLENAFSSATVLICNPNHKDIASVYHSDYWSPLRNCV